MVGNEKVQTDVRPNSGTKTNYHAVCDQQGNLFTTMRLKIIPFAESPLSRRQAPVEDGS